MTIEDDIAFLERAPILRLLGREALRILAIGAENRYVHGGEVLFKCGEPADAGYVVQEGTFSLTADPADSKKETTAGPGALLGEIALIADVKRPVTATATEPSTVIRIPRGLFLKMLQGYPEAAQRLRDAMAEHVQEAQRDLARIRGALEGAARKE
jgi:CRP-like cAMP-binding protein